MIEYLALIAVSLTVGYWLGTPETIEIERHDHEHHTVESAEYLTLAGGSGGGASGSMVVEEVNAEEVNQYE